MRAEIRRFVDDYFAELEAGNAAILAGAGLSAPAGFVDWRELLRPLAEEIELDVDRETDLPAVAQFHVNRNGMNRHRLHRAVIEALSADTPPTANHRLLARLPVTTWWTTNYDRLIEAALREAGKVVDVKSAVPQLANTMPRRDAVVYKMHGDVDRPDEAVVTRDDYEAYPHQRGAFINALAGDLVSKTFLFVGFSFTDPNLEHVLSRLRTSFKDNQRRHYALFRRRSKLVGESEEEYEHGRVRQILVLEDLRRYNVQAVLVDEYAEITAIFEELLRRYRRRTVFVSASAADFEPWGEHAVSQFMRSLGTALIDSGVRVATGLGLGVGNALFTGAVEEVLRTRAGHIEDLIVVRPFPQVIPTPQRQAVWEQYRQDIIGEAGLGLFLFGNKEVGGSIVPADGVRREFEIAHQHGLALIPVGATGSMARELAAEAAGAPETFLSGLDEAARSQLERLAEPVEDLQALVAPIAALVRSLRGGRR
ncbi:MAG TPA: SIR2 family protein [Sphingomonas sp.]|jgi:hypothetical protein|uniref:SIR2 family protein n=1 Tax=Sphingomonas sp. TaxID=28214 RepID=UPI002ED80FDC